VEAARAARVVAMAAEGVRDARHAKAAKAARAVKAIKHARVVRAKGVGVGLAEVAARVVVAVVVKAAQVAVLPVAVLPVAVLPVAVDRVVEVAMEPAADAVVPQEKVELVMKIATCSKAAALLGTRRRTGMETIKAVGGKVEMLGVAKRVLKAVGPTRAKARTVAVPAAARTVAKAEAAIATMNGRRWVACGMQLQAEVCGPRPCLVLACT